MRHTHHGKSGRTVRRRLTLALVGAGGIILLSLASATAQGENNWGYGQASGHSAPPRSTYGATTKPTGWPAGRAAHAPSTTAEDPRWSWYNNSLQRREPPASHTRGRESHERRQTGYYQRPYEDGNSRPWGALPQTRESSQVNPWQQEYHRPNRQPWGGQPQEEWLNGSQSAERSYAPATGGGDQGGWPVYRYRPYESEGTGRQDQHYYRDPWREGPSERSFNRDSWDAPSDQYQGGDDPWGDRLANPWGTPGRYAR